MRFRESETQDDLRAADGANVSAAEPVSRYRIARLGQQSVFPRQVEQSEIPFMIYGCRQGRPPTSPGASSLNRLGDATEQPWRQKP
jgi:hypothetical protein